MFLATHWNTVTLFGLVLAVGIVVDDAIIVVENVQRQMQEKQLTPGNAVHCSHERSYCPRGSNNISTGFGLSPDWVYSRDIRAVLPGVRDSHNQRSTDFIAVRTHIKPLLCVQPC